MVHTQMVWNTLHMTPMAVCKDRGHSIILLLAHTGVLSRPASGRMESCPQFQHNMDITVNPTIHLSLEPYTWVSRTFLHLAFRHQTSHKLPLHQFHETQGRSMPPRQWIITSAVLNNQQER